MTKRPFNRLVCICPVSARFAEHLCSSPTTGNTWVALPNHTLSAPSRPYRGDSQTAAVVVSNSSWSCLTLYVSQ